MKLIKINTDHYVIVDDSEIKEGDWMYLLQGDTPSTKQGEIAKCEFPDANNLGVTWKKITHTTQPLEWFGGEIIFLSEIKELIGEVDVEKKADDIIPNLLHKEYVKIGFIGGYNQALEDNKDKKYTEKDLRKMFIHGKQLGLTIAGAIRNGGDKPDEKEWFSESLQSKTEWEVEFDEQGKLRLV